jgi:hypothetical protein
LSDHPLLPVLGEANLVLRAWLRSGNTGAGQGTVQFLSETLSLLGAQRVPLKLWNWKSPRRFVVMREQLQTTKPAVGRKHIDLPGYVFRVFVASRNDESLEIWRDYNGRAAVECRIDELKNELAADHFRLRSFFATESAFLAVLFSSAGIGGRKEVENRLDASESASSAEPQ